MDRDDDGTATVLLLEARTHGVVGWCRGPDQRGGCPRAGKGRTRLPCDGTVIVPTDTTTTLLYRLHVPRGISRCPLSWTVAEDR